MKKPREYVADTQARKTIAFQLIKLLAMEAGYMRHERDTAGFERYCELLEQHFEAEPEHFEQ